MTSLRAAIQDLPTRLKSRAMGYIDFKNRTINRVPNVYRWILVAVLAAVLIYSWVH